MLCEPGRLYTGAGGDVDGATGVWTGVLAEEATSEGISVVLGVAKDSTACECIGPYDRGCCYVVESLFAMFWTSATGCALLVAATFCKRLSSAAVSAY